MAWVWHNKKDKGAQNIQFVYKLKTVLDQADNSTFRSKINQTFLGEPFKKNLEDTNLSGVIWYSKKMSTFFNMLTNEGFYIKI